jgi:carbonic anhydrase/acetyltransferase-like protein (isoleucine patch superfamily)
MILDYKGQRPRIGKDVFIAPTAVVIGDVDIGDNASVWFGAVVRGDMAPIRIGPNTNIQDNATVHTDHGHPAIIGANVTVGHNAVVHGCTLDDDCLVGIGAVVLSGAHVSKGSVVAAGSVVRENQNVGPHHLVAGAPAVFKKALAPLPDGQFITTVADYIELRAHYLKLFSSG